MSMGFTKSGKTIAMSHTAVGGEKGGGVSKRLHMFSGIASIHSAVITTCPLVRKQAQESFYNKDPVARTLILLIAGPSKLHSHYRSRSVLIQHLRPLRIWPVDLDSPILPRKPSSTTTSTKAISKSTDTSALYVSHTQRKRPQTPAASRAATISHTAETL
ncbi:hypothetical protein NA56DRAFT_706763 [Hyaloscypha hepaticicola]|uniref:Uncharacterized protein n=1 Tax=Hyaloscypha hepaticicola TaxID=2082293 RepID=A0A2J6PVT6_9HELO|nr:hypothetical protein NA56DRAFT_706763 [Hyaloscypha hepaticicola]